MFLKSRNVHRTTSHVFTFRRIYAAIKRRASSLQHKIYFVFTHTHTQVPAGAAAEQRDKSFITTRGRRLTPSDRIHYMERVSVSLWSAGY